jgi:hypothetical protein
MPTCRDTAEKPPRGARWVFGLVFHPKREESRVFGIDPDTVSRDPRSDNQVISGTGTRFMG